MQLKINGKETQTEAKTIQALLDELGIGEKTMAAAVNMNVIKKDSWDEFLLNDGDRVEFLEFVGGG